MGYKYFAKYKSNCSLIIWEQEQDFRVNRAVKSFGFTAHDSVTFQQELAEFHQLYFSNYFTRRAQTRLLVNIKMPTFTMCDIKGTLSWVAHVRKLCLGHSRKCSLDLVLSWRPWLIYKEVEEIKFACVLHISNIM